ncbi:MAG: hypothetical protein ACYCSW_11095 [bacterium]
MKKKKEISIVNIFYDTFILKEENPLNLTLAEKLKATLLLFPALFFILKLTRKAFKHNLKKFKQQFFIVVYAVKKIFDDNERENKRQITTEAAESNAPPCAPPLIEVCNG